MAERGIVPVSRLSVEAIVSRAVHRLSTGDALGRYARIAKAPGFSRAIASVLTELRLVTLCVCDTIHPAETSHQREVFGS
jgi:hypothetical protein